MHSQKRATLEPPPSSSPEGEMYHCLDDHDWDVQYSPDQDLPFTSLQHSVSMPITAAALFFNSTGPYTRGTFHIMEPPIASNSLDGAHQNDVLVDITVRHRYKDTISKAGVLLCAMRRRAGEAGLGMQVCGAI